MKVLNRLFIVVRVAGLATMLVPLSARASDLAFDAAGDLFTGDGHSIFKYTPDGTESTFATELKHPLGLCFDAKGNLFVSDGAVMHYSRITHPNMEKIKALLTNKTQDTNPTNSR